MTMMNDVKLLAKTILEHATEFQWELKGLGMMRTYLSDDAKLHVWDNRYAVPNVSLTHEHPWSFYSKIIAGEVRQCRLRITKPTDHPTYVQQSKPYMRSIVQCGPGGCLQAEPEQVLLRNGGMERYLEGMTYNMKHYEIHQSYPLNGTVTLVRRTDYLEPRAAAVYWPAGEEWVSSDPVMATPAKIRDIADRALETWFK